MKLLVPLASFFSLLGTVRAVTYQETGLYGLGGTDGSGSDPRYDISPPAKVQSITCRWTHRLDYLAVKYDYYVDYAKYHERGTEFGSITDGKFVDTRWLTQADSITGIAPYVCDTNKARGWICGLTITFAFAKPLRCGVDDTGSAHLPRSIWPEKSWHFHDRKFHSFFTTGDNGGKAITKIGWTWHN